MPTFNVNGTPPNGTIQTWTVPTTGPYRIEAVGAAGGNSYNTPAYNPGYGARMIGDFNLTAGQQLKILVGQKPPIYTSAYCNGGGGGTYVTLNDNTPLIVAGGGSGASNSVSGVNALTTNNGTTNGGTSPAAGAGLTGNGTTDSWVSVAAKSFTNGGTGAGPGSYSNYGGFGGGGCTHGNCGTQRPGGGGYNGGESNGGTGAGSYNNGTNQSNTAGYGTSDGYVVITLLNAAPNVPTLNAPIDGYKMALDGGATFTWTHSDPDADPQTGYAFRRKLGAGAYEYWNASTATWGAQVTNSTSTQSVTFPPGKWPTSTTAYSWSVATADAIVGLGSFAVDRTIYSMGVFTEVDTIRWDAPAQYRPTYSIDAIVAQKRTVTHSVDASLRKIISIRLSTTSGTSGDSLPSTPAASLGKYMAQTEPSTGLHNLFDQVTPDENLANDTEYRCVFVYNSWFADYYTCNVYIGSQVAGGSTITIGLDPTAASIASSSSPQAVLIADEGIAPAGVTFSSPTSGSPLSIGALAAGQVKALWLRRTNVNDPKLADNAVLHFDVEYP